MRKRGDIRPTDGFVFWGLERKSRNKDEFREKWLSPDYFARKKKESSKSSMQSEKRRKATDEAYAADRRKISKEAMRLYWQTRPKDMMVIRKKAFCKKHGIAFSLTPADFEIPDKCPLLGLTLARGTGIAQENSPELDRITPELGYVKGNVWVISRKANMIKTNASIDEIRLLVANWPW